MIILIIVSLYPIIGSADFSKKESNKIIKENDCECKNHIPITNDNDDYQDKNQIFDYPVMEEYMLATDPDSLSPKPEIVDVPDDFSWIDIEGEDWTSPIQDQGACGSCWLFAAIGCLECIINVRENCPDLDVDLSEQYVMSCLPLAGSCRGGIANAAFRFIIANSSWGNYYNGIIPESCFKYHGIDKGGWDFYQKAYRPVLCDYKCDDWIEQLIPLEDFGYYNINGSQEDIARIKSQVYTFGPVITTIAVSPSFGQWYNTHNSPDDYYPYEDYPDLNHNVVIVGWKDDDSIPSGGYWRIKNSWGTSGGYNGFFNIAYGSLHIDDVQIQWVDYNPDNYTFKPKADAGGLYYGNIGLSINFDASNSFAPETNIISYEWDFGDGTIKNNITEEHIYSEPGVYTVKLTIEDDIGNIVIDETAAVIDFWEVGDSWTYNFDKMIVSITGALNLSAQATLENLNFIVTEITDDYYIFNFEGDLSARVNLLLFYTLFRPGIYLTKDGKISGIIKLNKETFGIDNLTIRLNGKIIPVIGVLPLPLPLPFDVTLMNEFNNGYKILDFPIEVDKKWDFQTVRILMNTKFESSGLNILKIIDRISQLMDYPVFPDNYSNRVSGRPNMFNCISEESVTTQAGTFDSYKISYGIFGEELFNYHYSPEVGGIVKISAEVDEFQIPNAFMSLIMDGELVSTNY
jgi:C1A family cysteine protease